MRVITASILFLLPILICAEQPALEVRAPWIPEAPPSARMLAGYMELHNHGDTVIVITGAHSPAFSMAEIHRTEHIDGTARMRKQPRVEIPPGQSVSLTPGGLHLMLMRPARALHAGDSVELALIAEDGSEFPLTAQVRKRERK